MREAKSKELKKDLEILSQTFERVVDRKESVVKSLGRDLLEAEEQYSMALRSHLQNVDNLIGWVYYACVHLISIFISHLYISECVCFYTFLYLCFIFSKISSTVKSEF